MYRTLEELQTHVDHWLRGYNEERPHSSRCCYGKTPWQTFLESKHLGVEKDLRCVERAPDTEIILPVGVR